MVPDDLVRDVFEFVQTNGEMGEACPTGIDGFIAISNTQTTECSATFYEPIMCLVLQGAKEAHARNRVVRYRAGDTLIVSHAVALEAAVIQASPQQPYTALALHLDMSILRSMADEIGGLEENSAAGHSVDADVADRALIDAVSRLFRLSRDPVEAKALAPLVLREIHFRLLRAGHGRMLRQLLRQDSPASRISKAIAVLRSDFRESIAVADLAAFAGMSPSAFHEHFKAVTATTPLQYQKDLRLLEARQLLLSGGVSVAGAAYDVGYESPTQFSREFSRKFGASPSDIKSRAGAVVV